MANDYDCKAGPYESLRRHVGANGSVDKETATRVLVDAFEKEGITVDAGTRTCAGMVERAIKFLVSAGDLAKIAKDRYQAITWTPIAESDEYLLSSTGRLKHRESGKVLAVREDMRGRELVNLHGKTRDVARLTPVAA